jgi:polysaccharide pyruvyl transferase WcaK-like protein
MRKVNAAKRLFILGTYGCGNRGDEAILESVVRYFQDADIWITNGKCDDMRKYLPVRTVRCRLAEGKITPSVFFSILFHSFHQLYRILCSDALIYGGGSSIHDLTPYNLVYMFFWQWVAQHFGKKVFYLGMGIGPIATERGKKLCRKFLSKADGLYARDDRGYQLCVDQGIRNVQRSCDLPYGGWVYFWQLHNGLRQPVVSIHQLLGPQPDGLLIRSGELRTLP